MTSTSIPSDSEIDRVVDQLTSAREAGLNWLTSRISPDGAPVGANDVNSYYRVPWALATSGRLVEAGSVMSWMEREALTADGDLVPGAAQTPWTTANAPYPLAIMAVGAWHLERYDTANRIMDNLERFQDPETGGAFIEHPDHRATGRQDLLSTAQIGMAALATGRRDVADLAYSWVVQLIAEQPSLPDRLFVSTAGGRLVTDFPAGEAFGHVVEFQSPRQAFFNPGIGAAFMARYSMATGEEHALELGRMLLTLSENGTDQQYDFADTVHVGKFAWGAATMFEADPAESHLRDIVMLADWFVECQLADGRWNPSAFLFPTPNDADALWKTAEHIMLINFMLGSLRSRKVGSGA
jgi:hypothetical protein